MRTVAWEKLSELPMELALRSTKTPQNLTLVPYQQLSSIVESEKVHILCVVPERWTDNKHEIFANVETCDKEGTEFLRWKVLPSLGASNLVNLHRTESNFCISPAQKYLSLCWFKNLTRGCNIEEEMSSLSSAPSCH